MNIALKRMFSFAIVLALMLSIVSGHIEPFARAASLDANDPFAAMYDSDALIREELAHSQNALTPVGISAFSTNENNKHRDKYARQRADAERRAYESLTPERYIVKYREGSTADISSSLRGRVQRTERVQDKSSNVRSGNNRNQGHSGNNRNDNVSRIEVITLNERVNPQTLADELRRAGADREIEYIQSDIMLSLESLLEPEDEQSSEEDPTEEINPDIEDELKDESIEESYDDLSEDSEDEIDIIPNLPVTREGSVIVAVIDTGIDASHPALRGYMLEGWNFPAMNSNTYDPSYPLASAHGTHIAGTIAETAREYDADVKILPLQVFEDGTAYTSDILAAIQYAVDNGVSVINCSFGSTTSNPALEEAVANASDVLFVASVGNSRSNLDAQPIYPAAYNFSNVISVGSVNADGGFSYFSNYSTNLVDITALGRDVQSALPDSEYGLMSGTSMAAAQVSGAVAVLAANANTVISSDELSARILNSADSLENLQNKANAGRRLNINNAISGMSGQSLSLNPVDDFDVHGYRPTQEEQWELFAEGIVIQGVAGGFHSLALKSDGIVWAWGMNYDGQLGDGTTTQRKSPVQVKGLTNAKIIIARYYHSLALRADGTVWAWGDNSYGQLGDGTRTLRKAPVQVSGLVDIVAIAAGNGHSLALKSDGTVWAWGDNSFGQLGDGTRTQRTTPVQVSGLTGITAIGASDHSLALKSDGTVWAWGDNSYGQLGDGTRTQRNIPVQASNLTDISAITTGLGHSLALKSDRTVWAWGDNSYGQLGDGTKTQRTIPVQVTGLTDASVISAGDFHSLAIKSDNSVYAWGDNYYGQLGDGTQTERTTPVQVSGLSNITAIAAGNGHSIALKSGGSVLTWGWNEDGQLGNGTLTDKIVPTYVINAPTDLDNTAININYGEEFIVTINAEAVKSLNSEITLTYDSSKLQLLDFATQTQNLDVTPGSVSDTPLTIISHSGGVLTFSVNQAIPTDSTWSGVLTMIRFKALKTDKTYLSLQ